MPYLTIPLGLAFACMLGAVFIVWRKMAFLRKLTPEAHEYGDTWLHDMAPEVIDWARNIPWAEYKHKFLVELEKALRWARLLMSKADRLSDRMVKQVRKGHQEAARQVQEIQAAQIEAAKEEEESDPYELDTTDPEQLKMREQALIVQIAQDPKDADLYSELARVYMKLRNYNDAVESLSAAAKIDPANETYVRRMEFAKKRLESSQSAVLAK